jgi:hypothetical protein
VAGSSGGQPAEALFRMVANSGTYPECGFDIETTYPGSGVAPHTKALVTDGSGPGGRNYVRITFQEGGAGDGSWGWGILNTNWLALEPTIAQGAVRYVRFRIRVPTPFDWTNASGGAGTKFIDFAQLAGDTSRAVTQLFGTVVGQLDLYPYKGGGGGPGERLDDIGTDTWHNVQLRYVSSSTETATDGEIHVYLNADNDSVSTPTGSASGFAWDVEGWPGGDHADAFLSIGSIISPITAESDFVLDFCDFEYDDEFDANWNNPSV